MSHHLRKEKDCLNCGNSVDVQYCTHCGQENKVPRESFSHIMMHFVTDYLHLDHKFFGAIKSLLFKPGFLANEYNAGRRARYVHPFRFYIFISIVYFLLSGFSSHQTEKVSIGFNGAGKSDLTAEPMVTEKNTNGLQRAPNKEQDQFFKYYVSLEIYRSHQASLSEEERDNGVARFFIERIIVANEHGDKIGEKIQASLVKNAPKIIFFMLPVLALLLKFAFRKEKLFYVEHFFHSVYIHSFVFLLLSIKVILSLALPHAVVQYISLLLWLVPIYAYMSCRHVYKESAGVSAFKLLGVSIGYSVFLLIFFITAILLSIAAL